MTDPDHYATPTYATAGVDEALEQSVFGQFMRPWLSKTTVRSSLVSTITGLDSGYFATMMHFPPGPPLAVTTDGVGTKILLAREAGRYTDIGYDVVANNVNDLLCVGAEPIALLDYLATDRIEPQVLEQLAKGMFLGADEAGIAIPGGEIAQVGAMLADPGVAGPMLDIVGTAIGAMPRGEGADGWREPLDGSLVKPGDVVLGLPSTGLHSNGYSLARAVLMRHGSLPLEERCISDTDETLSDLLLKPTAIYVRPMDALWAAGVVPAGLVHISGGGLLNLGRLAADVSYNIVNLPPILPIFEHIMVTGGLPSTSMYDTFNMGTGFCIVLDPSQVERAITVIETTGHKAYRMGEVTAEPGRNVMIPSVGIRGSGDNFTEWR